MNESIAKGITRDSREMVYPLRKETYEIAIKLGTSRPAGCVIPEYVYRFDPNRELSYTELIEYYIEISTSSDADVIDE